MTPDSASLSEGCSGLPFTPADHRAICAFRDRLIRGGGRHTLATDHDFSPEVLEVFAAGLEEAAFVLWRETGSVWVVDLRPPSGATRELPGIAEALAFVAAELDPGIDVNLGP